MGFTSNLQQLKNERNLTYKQIGDACDMSEAAVRSWANGLKDPSLSATIKLADFFGVSIDRLVKDNIKKEPSVFENEELLNVLSTDNKKFKIACWIAGLDKDGVDRAEKLLDAALLKPKE